MQARGRWSWGLTLGLCAGLLSGCAKSPLDATEYRATERWGSEDAVFEPAGVAIDSMGYIFVADVGGHRVQKYAGRGRLVLSMGSEGDGPDQLSEPDSVAVDAHGSIYVSDSGNGRIQKFDHRGRPLTNWHAVGALAIGPRGWVYTLTEDRILRFTPTGRYSADWHFAGQTGPFSERDSTPKAIAVDDQGDVYVAAFARERRTGGVIGDVEVTFQSWVVAWFSAEGQHLDQWSLPGGETEGAFEPTALAVDEEHNVWLADARSRRVMKFTSRGRPVAQWTDGRLGRPSGVAVDKLGNVFVADRESREIIRLEPVVDLD